MILKLEQKYETIECGIKWLTWLLIIYILFPLFQIICGIYNQEFDFLFEEVKSLLPPITALLIVQIANRLIVNNRIVTENEQRVETVQVTHHAIIIVNDLKAKIGYVKYCIENQKPAFALIEVAYRIEVRYEALFDISLYKHLQGDSIDLIIRISGAIFGIQMLAEQLKQQKETNQELKQKIMPQLNNDKPIKVLDNLLFELEILLDHLFKIREQVK